MNIPVYITNTVNIPFTDLSRNAYTRSMRAGKKAGVNSTDLLRYPYALHYPYIGDWLCTAVNNKIIIPSTFSSVRHRDTPSNWDVSRRVELDGIFAYGSINYDLSYWDVSNVRSMRKTFAHISHAARGKVYGKTYGPNRNNMAWTINNWDPLSLESMMGAFRKNTMFIDTRVNISSWKTPALRILNGCFIGAYFPVWQLKDWDLTKVTSFVRTFSRMAGFVNLTDFKVIKLTPGANLHGITHLTVIANYCDISKIPNINKLDTRVMRGSLISGNDLTWVLQNVNNTDLSEYQRELITKISYVYARCYLAYGPNFLQVT